MEAINRVTREKHFLDLDDERTTPSSPPPTSHDRQHDELKSYDGIAMLLPYLSNGLSQHRMHTTYCNYYRNNVEMRKQGMKMSDSLQDNRTMRSVYLTRRRHILRNVLPYLNQSTMAMRPLLPCKASMPRDTTSDLNRTT